MTKKGFGLQGPRLLAGLILGGVAILLSFLRFRMAIPTGSVSVTVILPLLLAAFFVLGDRAGLLAALLVGIITLVLGTMRIEEVVALGLAIIVAVFVESRRFHSELVLSHRSLIVLGLTSGISQLVVLELAYAVNGLVFAGTAGLRIFSSLVLPAALFNGLLTALLTAPLSIFLRWLMARVLK